VLEVAIFINDKRKSEFKSELLVLENLLASKSLNFNYIKEDFCENKYDLLIAIGGDGTILRAVDLINNIPVLGVGLGYLGFLAETTLGEMPIVIDKLIKHEYALDKRKLLQIENDSKIYYGLNEVVVKSDSFNMTSLEMYINDEYITTYKADGLIVSGPTGSTAYNLSVGGPIIFPDTEVLVISPICPHSLNVRPLVISAKDRVKVQSKDNVFFAVDGKPKMLVYKNGISVTFSTRFVEFVRFDSSGFINSLRDKLKWSGSFKEMKD